MILRFDLPLPPNRGNARLHWRAALRQKKAYWKACDDLWSRGELPKRPRWPLKDVFLTVAFQVNRRNDLDNLMARTKWPLDWLTSRGYVVDDNPDALKWVGLPSQSLVKRTETGLTLILETA